MSNVIALLETMGKDSALRHGKTTEIERLMAREGIVAELQLAILGRDARRIEILLGIASTVCCALLPDRDNEKEEEPSRDDDEVSALSSVRFVATTS